MQTLESLLTAGRDWLPFAFAFIVIVVVLAVARRALIVRPLLLGGAGGVVRQLIMLLLTAIGATLLILSLPLSETLRGQILALIGLVLTATIALSSTTFIGNAMAGLMLRAVHNFRAGDFLRVGEHFGRVSEQGFLHTEIQTEDRDLTTLPNLYLVTTPVTVVRSSGTIVSATVSLSYDVPRSRVEALLKQAAERAELVEPFVQILDLGDFSVTYRTAGFLPEVKHLISARSRLRAMMLDALHEAGIEIVSPTFMNQRQITEARRFIPPAEPRAAAAARVEEIPESLMFDKAEAAQSIDQARIQMERVTEEIATTKKALDEAPRPQRAALEKRIEILEAQRVRFEERYERMSQSAGKGETGSAG